MPTAIMGLAIGGAVTLGLGMMFDAIEQCHAQQKLGAAAVLMISLLSENCDYSFEDFDKPCPTYSGC